MRLKTMLSAFIAGVLMLTPMGAGAATINSENGVVSIETPDDTWVQTSDPNYWFVISDGKNSITIDHLSNGEKLPDVTVANDAYKAVSQSFVSTPNEVFIVKGLAAEQDDLPAIMNIIGTIKILRFDTKTAVSSTPVPTASEFGLREINETYYSTTDELRVRTECSVDSSVIGELNNGDAVIVKGMVTRGGKDYGWYQIEYKGSTAFVSAQYISPTAPSGNKASGGSSSSDGKASGGSSSSGGKASEKPYAVANGFTVYDANGNNQGLLVLYSDGMYYSNDMQAYRSNGNGSYSGAGETLYDYNPAGVGSENSDLVQCEYCGGWFHEGNDYRNHVMAAHTSGNNDYDSSPVPVGDGVTVYDENGNTQGTLVPYSDGNYYSNDMQPYTALGNGEYSGAGEILYEP